VHRDALSGHFLRNDNDYWEESAEGPRWVRWAAYPWFDAAGGIGCIIISADDFTAVQISEQQLVESGRRYRELVEALPVALYTTDAEGVITLFNPNCPLAAHSQYWNDRRRGGIGPEA